MCKSQAISSTCAVGTVVQTLVPTAFDRTDLTLRKTEQMEGGGGSLLDVNVSDDGEIVGRGEDFFVLLLHVFKSPKEKTCFFLYASWRDRRWGQIIATLTEAKPARVKPDGS